MAACFPRLELEDELCMIVWTKDSHVRPHFSGRSRFLYLGAWRQIATCLRIQAGVEKAANSLQRLSAVPRRAASFVAR
jgi:hypothetical protein